MTISEINKTILKKLITDCNSDADIEALAENLVKNFVLINTDEVDWKLLREQKTYLIEANPFWDSEYIEGLIQFLDDIQDKASTILGDEAVFGEEFSPEKP